MQWVQEFSHTHCAVFAGSWNLCFFCCQGAFAAAMPCRLVRAAYPELTCYVLRSAGVLRLKSPGAVWQGVQRTWWPLLKGGWRVWPLVLFTAVHMLPRSTLAI